MAMEMMTRSRQDVTIEGLRVDVSAANAKVASCGDAMTELSTYIANVENVAAAETKVIVAAILRLRDDLAADMAGLARNFDTLVKERLVEPVSIKAIDSNARVTTQAQQSRVSALSALIKDHKAEMTVSAAKAAPAASNKNLLVTQSTTANTAAAAGPSRLTRAWTPAKQ
eukprot:GHVR01016439.1.p1 GENE.GHVR01016439.1~~GHVR01016439.1.p1  ORF type:complete len:170 (+),score=36.90 GHVR01016439.1:1274-1783(+)